MLPDSVVPKLGLSTTTQPKVDNAQPAPLPGKTAPAASSGPVAVTAENTAPLGSLLPGTYPTADASPPPGKPAERSPLALQIQQRTHALMTPDQTASAARKLYIHLRDLELTVADLLPADFIASVEEAMRGPITVTTTGYRLTLQDGDSTRTAVGNEYTFATVEGEPGERRKTVTKVGIVALAVVPEEPDAVWIEELKITNPLNTSLSLGQSQDHKGLPFKVFKDACRLLFKKIEDCGGRRVQTTGSQDLMVHHLYRKLLGFQPMTEKVASREAMLDRLYKISRYDFPDPHKSSSMEHFSRRLGLFDEVRYNDKLADAFRLYVRKHRVEPPVQVLNDADGKPVALWSGTAETEDPTRQQYLFLNPLDPLEPLSWCFLAEFDGGMPLKKELGSGADGPGRNSPGTVGA